MSHLRRILASEGLLKSAGWEGDVYIWDGSKDPSAHPDFPLFLAWAKKTAKKKRLIDNSANDAPFDRIILELDRKGLLELGLSGELYKEMYFPGEVGTYPSVGGDYNIPYEMGGETREVRISNVFRIKENPNGSWHVSFSRDVDGKSSYDGLVVEGLSNLKRGPHQWEVDVRSASGALKKATSFLRSYF